MRKLLILIILIFIHMFGNVVLANETGTPTAEKIERLDHLFETLKIAPNEQAAQKIEQEIWIEWIRQDDPQLDSMMEQAVAARRTANYKKSITILDQIVKKWSGYAEGWNQRATVHFLMGDYEKSLQDIYETLVREPRHFGSMAGRAVIRYRQAKPALAIQNIKAAMEFHPYLRERGMIEALMNGAIVR